MYLARMLWTLAGRFNVNTVLRSRLSSIGNTFRFSTGVAGAREMKRVSSL